MHSHPEAADTLIVGATLYDGTGKPPVERDVAVRDGRISAIGNLSNWIAEEIVEAEGRALAPGFIDVHTHDDTHVIGSPQMLPQLTQGVTTVIVGNCGISASPVTLAGDPPDPMNLPGGREAFRYPTFAAYRAAVDAARPAVNVAALVGHTALRNNHMDRLDRAATPGEVAAMRRELEEALAHGALGLSSGLAYGSANAAPTEEVMALAEPLAAAGAIYTTHMRSEFDAILEAFDEACRIGRHARVPVVISPRVLGHYARDEQLLSLEETIRKMTSLSARRFGLEGRGEVRRGFHADLVLFDPLRVRDAATFERPQQAAAGIDAVWVNGVASYLGGEPTGERAGRFVARGARAQGEGDALHAF